MDLEASTFTLASEDTTTNEPRLPTLQDASHATKPPTELEGTSVHHDRKRAGARLLVVVDDPDANAATAEHERQDEAGGPGHRR